MSKRPTSKRTEYEIRVLKVIKAANDYRKGEGQGQFPERRKIAKLTGISYGSVQQIIKSIEKETGIVYARNLTHSERGQRAQQSVRGEDYELY